MTDNAAELRHLHEQVTKLSYAMVHILMDMSSREPDGVLKQIYSDLAGEISKHSGYGGIGTHK